MQRTLGSSARKLFYSLLMSKRYKTVDSTAEGIQAGLELTAVLVSIDERACMGGISFWLIEMKEPSLDLVCT